MRLLSILLLVFGWAFDALAQAPNDECIGAIDLGRVEDYCSGAEAFTNVGATSSLSVPSASCQNGEGVADVWFRFIPAGSSAAIRVIGQLQRDGGGSITMPQFSVYEASCSAPEELACNFDAFGINLVELIVDELDAGVPYLLRVSALDSIVGSFELCITTYDFVPPPKGDCVDGVILCDKSAFSVTNLAGGGLRLNEVDENDCLYNENFPTNSESGSVWYRWTCDQSGSLGFTLTPSNPVDDLDFIVYELPGGIDDCANKASLRCMASGANVNEPLATWRRCSGATGMRDSDTDIVEQPGCFPADNNFISSIDMVSGRSYALLVNNFSATGNGFSIQWSGTGTFLGPKPSFTFDPEFGSQCDAGQITFTNESTFPPGSTGDLEWFFGEFADLPQGFGPGPFEVGYSGFGEKTITLRVTDNEGCVVTERRELFIEPCCETSTPLQAGTPTTVDPSCPGSASGSFEVPVVSGEPDYFFSIAGGPYLNGNDAAGLFAGTYDVFLRNIKGCEDTVEVSLTDPPSIDLEIGDNLTTDLGEPITVNAMISPPGVYSFEWSGVDSVRCINADCSVVEVRTGNPALLSVVASSPAGCFSSDELQLDVQKRRPLYVPTAFSPNGDGSNDLWTIYGPTEVAVRISVVRIYDRWGSLMFEAFDLPLNEQGLGWDGRHRDRDLRPDVFAFHAEIEYVDGVVLPVTGSINLVR